MASARDLKKQIRSISNTAKITGTMEMVATAKSKKAQDRITSTMPYSSKLEEILQNLKAAGTVAHPLLESRDEVHRNLLLVVTANRGLCGGYNANVLGQAEKWIRAETDAGRATEVYMVGKKGIARFRFLKHPLAEQYTHFEDKPSFAEAAEVAELFMRRFLAGEVDRVCVISTRIESISVQRPVLTQLLPVQPAGGRRDAQGGDGSQSKAAAEFLFEPDREEILRQLLPLSIKQFLFRILLEAAASEQFARRVAMKLATDNAEELIKIYTRKYNRERQAGITQQLIEIMTGAEALE